MEALRRLIRDEGIVKSDDILRVTQINGIIDCRLIDEAAIHLAQLFNREPGEVTKVLTPVTSGIPIAYAVARELRARLIIARKESDKKPDGVENYVANAQSRTFGDEARFWIERENITEDDVLVIVDDFIARGSAIAALLNIASQAGATVLGAGVLIEKVFECGRSHLSESSAPIHSLVKVKSLEGGIVTFQ